MSEYKFSGKSKLIEQENSFVGFRVIELPLGLIRKLVSQGKFTGASKLCEDYPENGPCSEFTAIQCNEFDGAITIMKNPDGTYKQLTKAGV